MGSLRERSLSRRPRCVWSPLPEDLSSAPHLSVGRLFPSSDRRMFSTSPSQVTEIRVRVSKDVCANSCDSTAKGTGLLVLVPRGYSVLCDFGLPVTSLGLGVSSVTWGRSGWKGEGCHRERGAGCLACGGGSAHHVPWLPVPQLRV